MSEQCNCEHVAHFPELWHEFSYAGPLRHKHLSVPAGDKRAYFVGAVCDDCADACMKEYLAEEE